MEDLIAKIKQKKELRGLADSFVSEELAKVLRRNKISKPRNVRDESIIIKEVRAVLRKHTGRFNQGKEQEGLLSEKRYSDLLNTHQSTKERLPDYPEFTKRILAYNPKSILDIGCGLNPLALARPKITYFASDINESDLKIVKSFFAQEHISGEVFVADAKKTRTYPKADIALLLKLVDLLDEKGHKKTEELILSLSSPVLVISFSTKTLSGKSMNHPQRGWIEQLCTRLGYTFSTWKTKSELYYFIERS